MTTVSLRWAVLALLLAVLATCPHPAQTQDVPPFDRNARPGDPPAVPGAADAPADKQPEVLGRGPIHQGFAQPGDTTPRPSPVVPKAPPAAIEEVPPEQRPEGDNVVWVPGYWAWDEDRSDFLWVSGFWRVPPPGRQWVPGSWVKVAGGYRFVSGYWGEVGRPAPLVDTPPESLDLGPSYPPIDDSYSWVPGIWITRDDRWLWRPGYWCAPRPGWIYTPASYCWTPLGCQYVGGFWDRCLLTRGLPFAPVFFPPGLCASPGFRFSPRFALGIGGLLGSFWARPGWGHYAFGDFYGRGYAKGGYKPWHEYGPRSRDPLWGYYRNAYARTNPGWARGLASTYEGRARGTLDRPPRSFVAGKGESSGLIQPLSSYRNPSLPLARATAADRAPRVERSTSNFRPADVARPGNESRPTPRTSPSSQSITTRPTPGTSPTRPPASSLDRPLPRITGPETRPSANTRPSLTLPSDTRPGSNTRPSLTLPPATRSSPATRSPITAPRSSPLPESRPTPYTRPAVTMPRLPMASSPPVMPRSTAPMMRSAPGPMRFAPSAPMPRFNMPGPRGGMGFPSMGRGGGARR